jgi:hypothetical protein
LPVTLPVTMSWSHAYASTEPLATRVKEMQKTDPEAKAQWNAWTDQRGQGGKKDPTKYDDAFLEEFVNSYNSGARLSAQPEESSELGTLVKTMQKNSQPFKHMWTSYNSRFGRGMNDPKQHDASYILKFFDFLASAASTSPQAGMMIGSSMESQAKRARIGGPPDGKAALVEAIKAYQRQGDSQREVWGGFVDAHLGGIRDPNRHDLATLQRFIAETGVPMDGGASDPYGAAHQAPMGGGANSDLAQRVKNFQKSSVEARETWYAFCGSVRDPARHEVEKLQEFCSIHGL